MANDLIFSINSAAPIFIVLMAGYLLKTKGFIDDRFIKQTNRLIFYIALPIKLFMDVGQTSFQESFDLRFIIFIVAGTLLTIPLCALVAWLTVKDRRKKGAFVQGAFRGNFLYVGYSLLENVMGKVGSIAPIAFAFIVPTYNVLGILVLAYYGESEDAKVDVKSMVNNIISNPLILSILAGVIFSGTGLVLPVLAQRSFSYFGAIVTPLALLMIGASFRPEMVKENFGLSLLASVLKLGVLPLLAVLSAYGLGFRGETLIVIYVIFGVPTAAVSYIIASIMGQDKDLATSIIMLTTLLSIVSITLFIFAFKTLGML